MCYCKIYRISPEAGLSDLIHVINFIYSIHWIQIITEFLPALFFCPFY